MTTVMMMMVTLIKGVNTQVTGSKSRELQRRDPTDGEEPIKNISEMFDAGRGGGAGPECRVKTFQPSADSRCRQLELPHGNLVPKRVHSPHFSL